MKKIIAILLTLVLIIAMMPTAAFGADDGGTEPPGEVTKTELKDSMVTLNSTWELYSGTAITLPTVIVSGGFAEDTDYTVAWSKGSEPVSGTTVTEVGTYTATVTPTNSGKLSGGPVTKTFEVRKVDFAKASIRYNGSTDKPDGFDAVNPGPLTGPWNATVTQDGKTVDGSLYTVSAEKLNATTIRVIATLNEQSDNTTGSPIFVDFTVTTKLKGYKIIGTGADGKIPDQVYNNGNPLKPTIYVVPVATQSGTTGRLIEGTDYTVSYTNNTQAGKTATITVKGIQRYSGQLTATFAIVGKDISKVSVEKSNTLAGQEPSFILRDGSTELKEGTDYTITSYNSVTIGTNAGTAVITGKGNYSGTRTERYNVISAGNQITSSDITLSTYSPYYNGATQTPTITVKKHNSGTTATLVQNRDYTVSYVYTDGGKTVRTTAPRDAKIYTVYVTGIGNYATNGEINAGTFTIRQVPLDWAQIVLGSSTVTYNGVSVPKVTLRHISGNFSFPESDYKVTYRYVGSNYTYLKPTVVVTPVEGGNLTTAGSTAKELTKEFSLATKDISSLQVRFSDGKNWKEYDGKIARPTVTVRDLTANKVLTQDTDYTVTYKDADGKTVTALQDAGNYTVVVTGTGLYKGTVNLTYTIYGTDISRYAVTLKEYSASIDNYSKKPAVVSVTYGSKKLAANEYEVSYIGPDGKTVDSISAVGTYRVTVTGKKGYTGSTYASYRVVGYQQTMNIAKTAYKVYTTTDPFRISATATGDGTGFTYTSNNPSVATVSATGVVTVHKLGRAVITVTTAGNKKYESVSDQVYIKVYPSRTTISQKPWKDGKNAIRVRWDKQDDVTKYQIRYSRDKNFKAGTYKTKTVSDLGLRYDTQSTKLTNLKKGQRYYFKVRAIKEVYNESGTKITYYGNWSLWRSAVVK